MDAICRAQPEDATSLKFVESALMRRCCTAVLLHSVRIKHLPTTVKQQACAITLTVNGISYTTAAAHAKAEEEEVNEVTGERSPALGPCLSASRKKPCDVFSLRYDHLELIFPGDRIPAYAMSEPQDDIVVANPREFANGIHVSVHTVDLNHVYGTALCKTSGEVAYLSYPRGAVTLNFRVYPCVAGEVMLQPLYNKPSFATLYLQGGAAAPLPCLTEGPAAADETKAADEGNAVAAAEKDAEETNAAVAEEKAGAEGEANEAKEEEEANKKAEEEEEVAAAAEEEAQPCTTVATAAAAAVTTAASNKAAAGAVEAQLGTPKKPIIAEGTHRPITVEVDPLMEQVRALVPCFTEARRQAVFDLYDTEKKGYLTREQLLHFCKAHVALSDTWGSEYDVMEYLAPYVPEPTPPVSRERGGEAARPRSARGYTYYRPASAEETDAPLQINMDLFTLICLKLVRT